MSKPADCNPFTDPPRLTIEQVKTEADAEAFLNQASEAFHADPSHPSSCPAFEEHYSKRCVCEDEASTALRKRGF